MAVTRLEITGRKPWAGGTSFSEAGPYELIEGRIHFAVDSGDEHNSGITDIALAPRNAEGNLEFSSDFTLAKPVRAQPGGRLLYDVLNRGNKTALRLNLATPPPRPDMEPPIGDGFLMRNGFSLVWCGWQTDPPDAPGLLRGYFPEALEHGQRLQGQTFLQFQPSKLAHTQMLSDAGHRPLPAASLNDTDAILTVRDYHDGPPATVSRHLWQFARPNQDGAPVPDASFIYSEAGFEPGKVYELVYSTIGAPVAGLGLLAMRDCTSWLRYADSSAGNPLSGDVGSAYGFGVSLSGRFIREFLYQGMNEDEAGRSVFDGLLTVVGSSRRGEFNIRFAQPSTNIARAPGNQFPFSYADESDPLTRRSGSLLARIRAQGKMPKLMAVNSGMEYWWSGASLQHIDVTGTRDLEIPEDVRTYYFCGTQHAGGSLPLTDRTPDGFRTIHPMNTVNYAPMLRAALLNLDRWVREGVAPPDSAVPCISAGTAVSRESLETAFRSIPSAGFPAHLPRRPRMDYGPRSTDGVMSYPPIEGTDYVVLTSSLNSDLNEVGGVQPLDLRVPLATYTGWNLRHPDVGQAGEYVSSPLPGSTLPFAKTQYAREQNLDPRRSIEERYRDKADYLAKVRATAKQMLHEGHLLAEDLLLVERDASERWDAFVGG